MAPASNIANIIPNTVTGNSDTADYKDTVFFNTAANLDLRDSGCEQNPRT